MRARLNGQNLVVGLWLAGAAITGTAQQPATAQARVVATPTVRGRVVSDAEGLPLRHVRLATDSPKAFTESDADGRFELPVPRGTTVAARQTGFATAHATLQDDVVIRLARGAVITGLVTDDVGAPWATMVVVAERRVVRDGHARYERATAVETDDRGEYRLFDLPSGDYIIGIAGSRVPLPDSAAYAPPVLLTGPVLRYYPDARTPEQAQVISVGAGAEQSGIAFTVVMTASLPVAPSTVVQADETGVVRGRVIGNDGSPARHASVRLSSVDGLSPFVTPGSSDGQYEFDGVPAGRYLVSALALPYQNAVFGQHHPSDRGEAVTIASGDLADHVDIIMPRVGTVAGHVFNAHGEPLDGVAVSLKQVQWARGRRRLVNVPGVLTRTTNDLGRFRLFGVPPGRYLVSATLTQSAPEGGEPAYVQTFFPEAVAVGEATVIDLSEGQDLDSIDISLVRQRVSRVSGRVVAVNGQPFSGAVFLTPSARSNALAAASPTRVRTEDGTFAFEKLAPGEYIIQAAGSRDGEATEGPFGTVFVRVDGQDVDDIIVRESAGSSVRGRLLTESGALPEKMEDVEVTAVPSDEDYVSLADNPVAHAAISDDGTFELAGLNGPRRLQLSRAPSGWRLKAVYIGGIDVTDEMQMFGTAAQSLEGVEFVLTDRESEVAGTITDGRQHPASDATAIALSVDPSRWYVGSRFISSTEASDDGTFTFRGLPPGDFFFAAIDNSGPPDLADQLTNPAFLEMVARQATRATVPDSGRVALRVVLSAGPEK